MTDLKAACGQLLSVGFEGTSVPEGLRARIAAGEVGGVMLFSPNVATAGQVAGLVGRLRGAASGAPLVVSVDQEGGRVQRLKSPLTEWPPMAVVGRARDVGRTETLGRYVGEELRALGIGWNLAPVLDVHTNPENPVIGDRSFAPDATVAAAQALAFWRGLRGAGLAGCGKHFPGHGDTAVDSHLELPVVRHDQARIEAVELAPFRAAAAAGMEAIMTAHVLFPALDPARPATLSPIVLTEILRGRLGFAGMIVSDDLSMGAVAYRHAIEDLVVESLMAGVDHFLIRRPEDKQRRAFEALVRAAEARADVRGRVAEARARVAAFKSVIAVPDPAPAAALPSLLGTPAHKALAGFFARHGQPY
jgi:beta-N-acetylhexosaminidase